MSDKQKLYEVIKNLHNQVVIGGFNQKSYCTLLYQLMTSGLISQEMGIDCTIWLDMKIIVRVAKLIII